MLLQYLLPFRLTGGEKGGLGGLHPEDGVAGYEVIELVFEQEGRATVKSGQVVG